MSTGWPPGFGDQGPEDQWQGGGPSAGPGQHYDPPPAGLHRAGPSPGRRPRTTWLLIAAGAAAAAAVAGYALTLGSGRPPHTTAAAPTTAAGTSSPPPGAGPGGRPGGPSTAPPATAPPAVGGDGNVAAPARIDSLYFNPVLSSKYITNKLKNQLSYDFGSFPSGVVGGFYTQNPAAKGPTHNYQLLFDVAYLAGAGHPDVAIKSFLGNHTLQSPVEIPAGPLGGRAGCSWVEVSSGRIAHCMWADKNTYADFYAWRRSPAALARVMLAARPQIERSGGSGASSPRACRPPGGPGCSSPGMAGSA